jgi:hypothetical protein
MTPISASASRICTTRRKVIMVLNLRKSGGFYTLSGLRERGMQAAEKT